MNADDLRAYRGDNDLTQDELAWLLGVHTRTVQRWESGERGFPHWVPHVLQTYEAGVTKQVFRSARAGIARTSKRRGARA